ncbi:Lovastatin nonaketide synthase-like protein [Emericellopsis cladophorae]|uniref:Lovastatin nonaketide synthase-like protein n=1 Tax=Emericellopsis cladophorae TaxID=2686198 RepID=A0A9P9XVJ9_9HYPO|nr:Lovastatin nonaketide synthase-like protein [Emericellopsis cladophorae]KAI6778618.1 Lovastatin nonaketide synthase-like protein [Emericellopsis cladophorae]
MGSIGPGPVPNGSTVVNGSAPVNGHSPAEPNGGNYEPIAVVGMSCRLSGDASDTQKLWELLTKGGSAWSKTPKDRFNQEGFRDPSAEGKPGRAMDPQQRLVLEIAYEAFENAGLTMEQISGSNTGVYVGQWTSDYQEMLLRDIDFPPVYQAAGVGAAITSNRVSYCFNLQGPSFTIDSGCSASMVALHQAVQSLRMGETEKCFVAGVNLLLDPQRYGYQNKYSMFSKSGKSYSFDSRAKGAGGYGRGEGCSGVVLMPLSQAEKQGHSVRAIIRNSASNQDGKTNGITVPSAAAQAAAIERAYAQVGLEPYADYVEAHGTGTSVGDPIEARAIGKVLGAARKSDSPLPIGSIKANIGHTESAAGLTGLIKAVLMLENNMIPPQANFEQANPDIDLDSLKIRIATTLETRPLKRISVNSFGYGGTNCHVVIDAADAAPVKTMSQIEGIPATNGHGVPGGVPRVKERLFVLSAASEKSCQQMASNLAKYLEDRADSADADTLLGRLAYTLSRRSVMENRVGIVASDLGDLTAQLTKLSTESIPRVSQQTTPRIGFVFSGQGAQYPQMGRSLLGTWPVFTDSMKRAAVCLRACGSSWDLFEELLREPSESRMEDPCIAQPISTAVQISLVDTLKDLGVIPTAVAGHSSGEIAAAYCAKAILFEDAITVAYHRGRLTSELRKENKGKAGAMIAIGASATTVKQYIDQLATSASSKIAIACFNSPSSVTVSGDEEVISSLKQILDEQDIWNRLLRTGGAAYHSPQMLQIASKYHEALKDISDSVPISDIGMVSSVTGEDVRDKPIDRDYWVYNLVSPVRFTDALKKTCVGEGGTRKVDLLLELGSHFQLEGPIKQTVRTFSGEAAKIQYAGSLKRGEDAQLRLLAMLRSLYYERSPVAFWRANAGFETAPEPLSDLPPYPFDRAKTHWHESRVSRAYKHRQFVPHELLGTLIHDNNPNEPRWRCYLNLADIPWLSGHIIQGQTILPATAYLAMVFQAARQDTAMRTPQATIDRFILRNVVLSQALVMEQNKPDLEISLSLRPQVLSARKSSPLWQEFRVFSTSADDVWTEHCRGLLQVVHKSESATRDDGMVPTRVTLPPHAQHVSAKQFYHRARDIGINWSAPFDKLTSVKLAPRACIADCSFVPGPSAGANGANYTIHPGVMDAVLYHGMIGLLIYEGKETSPVVPTFIEKMVVVEQDSVQEVTCHAKLTEQVLTFDVGVFEKGKEDNMVVQASGVIATKLPNVSIGKAGRRELCHVPDWVTYMPKTTQKHMDDICQKSLNHAPILETVKGLDALTIKYVKQALASTPEEEVAEGYQRAWYNWMKTVANEEPDPVSLKMAEVDDSLPARIARRLGASLGDILRGTTHALSILNEDSQLSNLYNQGGNPRTIAQIAAYMGELGRMDPNMKIIEVGAGTGSATLPILQALQAPNRVLASSYDFTDISPGFFPSARELLSEFEGIVQYKTLDVEKSAEDNSFAPNSYDVLIASNVLHATPCLDVVLENVKSLLRPGGKLILMEPTRDLHHYGLIFGSLAGWWAGVNEGRTLSPMLTVPQWKEKLTSNGFIHNGPIFEDWPVEEGGSINVFVVETPPQASSAAALDVDIVSAAGEGLYASFTDQLQKKLWDRSVEACVASASVSGDKVSIIMPDFVERVAWDLDDPLFNALKARVANSKLVVFVTLTAKDKEQRPSGEWVYGFVRSVRFEYASVRLATLELEGGLETGIEALTTILNSPTADMNVHVDDVELEFLDRDSQLYVYRMRSEPSFDEYVSRDLGRSSSEEGPFINGRAMSAELGITGVLDTIRWADNPTISGPLDPDCLRLQLCAASVNFKDVLIASGQLEGITKMNNDCSGVVLEVGANMTSKFKAGDRVCALYSQSFTNYPVVHGSCCQLIPEDMDFAEAASIPLVWSTVYYSLITLGKLQKGESILIHSAAGAVGQASIILAQYLGAEIFVTCGNEAKVELLNTEFNIPRDHIFSSRSTAFRHHIRAMTNGHGVDVVLNSLGGEMFRESCNTVAGHGRFVEIGRKDLMEDALMPMQFLLDNITFAYVDFAHILATKTELAAQLMGEAMKLFTDRIVRHVQLTKYSISEMAAAFRLIQAGKHTGKVILTVEPEVKVQVVPPKPKPAQLNPEATYIVVGGLGGLGRQIVDWTAGAGARHIVIFSRTGRSDPDTLNFLDRLASEGITVRVEKCDVTSEDQLQESVAAIQKTMPPIRGLFQAAMILHDVLLEDMTFEQWKKVTLPKIQGTWNLHKVLPADLDFFIMLSSVVSLLGTVGAGNYSSANAFQDGMARYRRRLGLPAYALNIGAIVEAGYVSENPEVAMTLRKNGLGSVSMDEFLSHLNDVVQHETVYTQSSLGILPNGTERELGEARWAQDRRLAQLFGSENQAGGKTAGRGADDVGLALQAATTFQEAVDVVSQAIVNQLATILATDANDMIPARSLDSYGLDSLVGVELRNWIGAYLQVNLPLLVMWNTSSITELAKIVAKGSRLVKVKSEDGADEVEAAGDKNE